jgi:Arc/MetJ-type ribon-helix-helix transcriptional regulator
MPASLVQELKQLTQEHHYIDMSEQVRSVVRQKCLKYLAPYDEQRLADDVERRLKSASNQKKKEQILQELARLLKEEGA